MYNVKPLVISNPLTRKPGTSRRNFGGFPPIFSHPPHLQKPPRHYPSAEVESLYSSSVSFEPQTCPSLAGSHFQLRLSNNPAPTPLHTPRPGSCHQETPTTLFWILREFSPRNRLQLRCSLLFQTTLREKEKRSTPDEDHVSLSLLWME